MDITSYVMGSIAGARSASALKYLVVDTLPEVGEDNVIYLVPKTTSGTNNYYDEYMYINNAWELIGDTEIDLSNYLQESDLKTINGESIVGSGDISVGDEVIIIENTSVSGIEVNTTANKEKIKYILDNYDNIMNMKVYLYCSRTTPKIYIPLTTIQKNSFNEFWLQGEIGNQGGNYGIKWGIYYSPMKFYVISGMYANDNITISTQQIRSRYILNDNTSILGKTNTFEWTPTGNYNPATKKYVDDRITQYETLPTASASNEGKIAQYIGATDSNYTNGYFYQVVSDGEDPATYSWGNIEVQAGGSGGGTKVIDTNSNIWELEAGDYIINRGITVYIRGTSHYVSNYNFDIKLFVGSANTSNQVPYIIMSSKGISFHLSGSSGGSADGSFIISGYANQTSGTGELYRLPVFNLHYGLDINASTGTVTGTFAPYSTYLTNSSAFVISKGTLENVITGKGLQSLTQIYQLAGLSEYSSSSTYAVDDYVYYNNLIYKCSTAVETAEDFDDTKWTQKTYIEYLKDTLSS